MAATSGAVCLTWWDGGPASSRLSLLTDCLALHLHSHPITHSSCSSALGVESGESHVFTQHTHTHDPPSPSLHPSQSGESHVFTQHTHTSPSTPHSVGGSLPVAFSYFCEFFTKKNRGAFVIILASFWITGSVFAALVAWAVIPNLPTQGNIGFIELRSWRIYVMLCTIPCLTAAIALLFMPETPYFLYSVSGTMSFPFPPLFYLLSSFPFSLLFSPLHSFSPSSLSLSSLLPPLSSLPSLPLSLFLSPIRKAKLRRQ